MTLILSGTDGLSDVDGTAATPAIRGTDANTGIFFPAADTIAFSEGGVEAMRIDSSGNVGIGVTPSAWSLIKGLQVTGGGFFGSYLNNSYMGANWYFDGTSKYIASDFATQYEQNDGKHIWYTAPSGTAGNAITFTQAMTLDSSGNLILGGATVTTNPIAAGVNGTALSYPSTSVNIIARASATQIALQYAGNSGQNIQFYTDNGGAVTAGTITSTGTATAYGVGTSDYRAKENVSNYTGGLSTITSLRPVSFTWKESQEQDVGFIAHEIQAVIPSTVHGEKDAIDEDGKPKMQIIFPAPPQMIANLVAAIQEQQALITALTARITALETP